MTRPQVSNMFSLLSVTNTKELSIMPIITNTANNILENVVLFFLALFISLCGGGSSSESIIASDAAHFILVPQQRKSLYYMLKKNSDQDQSQPNIKNYKSKKSRSHSTHHRSTSANPTTSY
ncbi:4083_t:CDS:2 [Dentiscutata erythropus]|uniref:4083_t:CDS:1 n=1 Tax=Dentiscutata erythropus TaxID=1348616 RepID=A0A9N8Z619_9GLOM|nr:4083_t:CDS:2 [Dentiscutata erythropus]